MSDPIRFIKRHQVDEGKWNGCLESSSNGLIYAYTFYLDQICPRWEALVYKDYECIMPIVRRSKLGISYIYDPPFVQRLGVFGPVDEKILHAFYSWASEYVRYIDCHFSLSAAVKGMTWKERVNFILPLNNSYLEIRKGYSEEGEVNIRKAIKRKCRFESKLPVNKVIDLYRTTYGHYHSHIGAKDYQNLFQTAMIAKEKGMLLCCGVMEEESDDLLFGALLFLSNRRIYYTLAAPSKAGRTARAGYFFIDEIIRRYAGSDWQFDFEGSDIPNVAAFYKRFGPLVETYYRAHLNRLPWPLRLLRK